MLLLVNLFVLLSVVCVLLNLAAFILCCQGAQLVSSMTNCQLSEQGDICYCCAESASTKCEEDKMLKIYPGYSCNTMRVLLKKVLFALCALNAVTTAVCLVAAALRYLQIFSARRPCAEEPQATVEAAEEQPRPPDPDEFVPPAPPPSYFSTFYSYTPRLARRMFGDSVIPLPHIYGARIKGVEVFCPLDPPPPYEAVAGVSSPSPDQETPIQMTDGTDGLTEQTEAATSITDSCLQTASQASSSASTVMVGLTQTTGGPVAQKQQQQELQQQQLCRSNSDPLLTDQAAKVLSCEAATQTDTGLSPPHKTSVDPITSTGATVTLRRGGRGPRRARPASMVDYQSYRDTKLLVTRFLEHSSSWSSLAPEVQELVNSIRSMLRSDQEHMEEAVRCASVIDQVITGSKVKASQPESSHQSATSVASTTPAVNPLESLAQTLPRRKRPGQLHLRSCGDLSTFTWAELHLGSGSDLGVGPNGARSMEHRCASRGAGTGSRMGSRAGSSRLGELDRPHSLIGVFRETVL